MHGPNANVYMISCTMYKIRVRMRAPCDPAVCSLPLPLSAILLHHQILTPTYPHTSVYLCMPCAAQHSSRAEWLTAPREGIYLYMCMCRRSKCIRVHAHRGAWTVESLTGHPQPMAMYAHATRTRRDAQSRRSISANDLGASQASLPSRPFSLQRGQTYLSMSLASSLVTPTHVP